MPTEAIAADAPTLDVGRQLILGQPVHPVSRERATQLLLDRAQRPGPGAFVCLTNVHTTVESRRSAALRAACESAFLSVPDGMPLVWILRRRGYTATEKIAGIEYIPTVAAAGLEHEIRHFFFGGAPGVAEAAARNLRRRVPGTLVVGAYAPPFGRPEQWPLASLQAQLREQRPHIMWVGLGAPKQEIWMARVARDLEVPVMVGVGAAFDFLAGTKPSAPRFLSSLGLEWLFRLVSEPRRLWRRYLVGNAHFLYLLAREALTGASDS